MAKIVITDDNGAVVESDTFVAITVENEGNMWYTQCFTSIRHLNLSGHLVVAASLADTLNYIVKEATKNSGADLLFDHRESYGERTEDEGKEKDDGSGGAS